MELPDKTAITYFDIQEVGSVTTHLMAIDYSCYYEEDSEVEGA